MKTDSANGQQPKANSQQPTANGQQPAAKSFPFGKIIRVFLIIVVSLLLLLVLGVSILLWVVFTPSRLSPIVQRQAERHLPYPTKIESVELTFFSTFPDFGIRIDGFSMMSPFDGARSDTLASARMLTGVIDVRALWRNEELIVRKLHLEDSGIHLFIDSLGQSNFGLLLPESTTKTEEGGEMPFGFVHLRDIMFQGLDIAYHDEAMGLRTSVNGLSGRMHGTLAGNFFSGNIQLRSDDVSLGYAKDQYLSHAEIDLRLPLEADLSNMHMTLKQGSILSVNGMGLEMSGTVTYDEIAQGASTDLAFQGGYWMLDEFLAMIPSDYLSLMGEFEASGMFSPGGRITGLVSADLLPLAEINISLHDGSLVHEWVPFPMNQARGDMALFLDMSWERPSVLEINHLEVQTPLSYYETRGRLHDLMGDMRMALSTVADVAIEEFKPWIPVDMAIAIGGRASGKFRTDFLLSEIMNLQLENLRIDGSARLTGFSATYDTVYVATDLANIDLALPGKRLPGSQYDFAGIAIRSDSLFAMAGDSISAMLLLADIAIDMSDVRDTTTIPHIQCVFDISRFRGQMGNNWLAIDRPNGRFNVRPNPAANHLPVVVLDFEGTDFAANYGGEMVDIEHVRLKGDVYHDDSQDDLFLQWMANGYLDMRNGVVNTSHIPYPLEIPSVSMDFTPETFAIHEGRVRLGRSDFGLSGLVQNILSYARGDSLLRGDFLFVADHVDLGQLMALTSGVGADDENHSVDDVGMMGTEAQEGVSGFGQGVQMDQGVQMGEDADNGYGEETFSGPYMVPRGVDISLDAMVRQAVFGQDTISNISGEVRVSDGVLVFDGVDFTTPAADMRLTAMYRTPRRNHLYLGIDYHMFDIDIERLLRMIPDIDTLMPMLRSFRGSGEFHMAVETYLDSLYNIKKSTLRGASSIRGRDLVLLDGETFSEIARTLRFSKRAENRVDSLAAEFTIFREEIDIYPFLIVMDRYRAVVAGRHNFDMSFNYHISLVDSPLPIRLGIDITGTLDRMNYRLASPRFAELYRPASRRAVESRQLELRRMIREALMQNIE